MMEHFLKPSAVYGKDSKTWKNRIKAFEIQNNVQNIRMICYLKKILHPEYVY